MEKIEKKKRPFTLAGGIYFCGSDNYFVKHSVENCFVCV